MRKNGVNKQISPVAGGVCAPAGFKANAIRCGCGIPLKNVSRETEDCFLREDLALILADKRCPVACTYAQGALHGATAVVTQKHVRWGYARAMIANSGVANVFGEKATAMAQDICALLAKHAKILTDEIVIASTGLIGEKFDNTPILNGIAKLVADLAANEEKSLAAARALMTTDRWAKHAAFSFELGAFTCKIGAVFKGNARVCPNMATTLCFLTTDVNITPEMLQKALNHAVDETFNMMNVDGVSSPNDMVCIMASGEAGNCQIDAPDSEYAKFVFALKEVLARICRTIVDDGAENGFAFECRVKGAKSQRMAKSIARTIVGASTIKDFLKNGEIDVQSVLCAIYSAGEAFGIEKLEISFYSDKGQVVVFDEGTVIKTSKNVLDTIFSGENIALLVDLHAGNYSATAIGCVR